MSKVVIVDAVRTPIGKFLGGLSSLSAAQLGSYCLRALLDRVGAKLNHSGGSKINALIDEVVIGNVLSAGLGQNLARQIAIHGGLPKETPATTVNMVCGSGLKAVILASQQIALSSVNGGLNSGLGEGSVMLAGGSESMSQAPYLLNKMRTGNKLGNSEIVDSIMRDGLQDAFHDYPMGITAENIAKQWKISREKQDEFAYHSQLKTKQAEEQNLFSAERITLEWEERGKTFRVEKDEYPRHDSTLEQLSSLKPVFITSSEGTVTAGNSSGINDGATMLLLMSEEKAQSLGIKPLATILATTSIALDETIMGYGPYHAIKKIFSKTGLSDDDIFSYEINEAFAAQSIAVIQDLSIKESKVNPLGGAIALGHPIGASGARILTTLAHHLDRNSQREKKPLKGIASLCIGGGQGCAVLIESNLR